MKHTWYEGHRIILVIQNVMIGEFTPVGNCFKIKVIHSTPLSYYETQISEKAGYIVKCHVNVKHWC